MDRQPPRTTSDEIDLYINTYYSLLRSTGDVRVRGFEEAHSYSKSSLHPGARDPEPDVGAFGYSAARLPRCMPQVRRVVLGQSEEQFAAHGFAVREWEMVRSPGRRRVLRWDGGDTLAAFVTSISDIDDLVPILTAYQIEWNKMRGFGAPDLGLDARGRQRVAAALGRPFSEVLELVGARACDLSVRLLYGSFNQYQRSAQRWWSGIEPRYLAAGRRAAGGHAAERRPVYFVSSNTHSLVNLTGGAAAALRDEIVEFSRDRDPESLAGPLEDALDRGDEGTTLDLLYYLLRAYIHDRDAVERRDRVQRLDAESGIETVLSPGRIDVGAQLIPLAGLRPERLDPRVRVEGLERLADSDAVIINIDYPLGLAAYHHLSRLAQGVGELRGVYVMGKAATLNGRVGDVMVPGVVYDEHSKNTYLFDNGFESAGVQPLMREGTVLDNQKAVTVRSAFLQNRRYMSVFYNEGYTIMEMEAGPYLSAVHEIVSPRRHPNDEIVNLFAKNVPFDVGILHYASDTPYSRRQALLSKSLSFFGVESTYACAIAILRRVLEVEIAALGGAR